MWSRMISSSSSSKQSSSALTCSSTFTFTSTLTSPSNASSLAYTSSPSTPNYLSTPSSSSPPSHYEECENLLPQVLFEAFVTPHGGLTRANPVHLWEPLPGQTPGQTPECRHRPGLELFLNKTYIPQNLALFMLMLIMQTRALS